MNYFFPHSDYSLGLNLNFVTIRTDSPRLNQQFQNENYPEEWLLDLAREFEKGALTVGLGQHRGDTFDLSEKSLPWAYGATYTFKRNNKRLSRASLGLHHIPKKNKIKLLLSFIF